jgi:hypothetical protein
MGGVRTIGSDSESLRVHACRAEFQCCAVSDIPGEKAEHDSRFLLQTLEQAVDSGHDRGSGGWLLKLGGESLDIAAADRLESLVRERARVSCSLEQLGYDLGIGLSIEPDSAQGPGIFQFFSNGGCDGPAPGSGCQQKGSVDVEENEASHLSSILRTATSRSRRTAARLPGSQGSTNMPPQASVEWTSVSASPANATWLIRDSVSLRKNNKSPGRASSSGTGDPQSTC